MLQDMRTTKTTTTISTSLYQQVQVYDNIIQPSRMSLDLNSWLSQLQNYCLNLYPNQQHNLIKTERPFVLGGSEPLDFIYIFKNNGDHANNIPQHWHYVGFGLTDIHNYGMVYDYDRLIKSQSSSYDEKTQLKPFYPTNSGLSGFGFELTFRIKCNSLNDWHQNKPPKWPCNIMQALAKYVFQSKNVFSDGDHIAWQAPLSASKPSSFNSNDNSNVDEDDDRDSIINNMIMTLDPQLRALESSLAMVKFVQIVGVTQDELQAAREWNVKGILDIMKENSETGGEFLITDMSRSASIFQLNPDYRDRVDYGIGEVGSDMSIVTAKHKYSSKKPIWFINVEKQFSSEYNDNNHYHNSRYNDSEPNESDRFIQEQDNNYASYSLSGGVERGNLLNMPRIDRTTANNDDDVPMRCSSRMSYESESELKVENLELTENRYYDQIYILISLESAKLLPVGLNGRLAHKKPFHYKTSKGDLCTTLIPEGTSYQSLVSPESPYIRRGAWLQIYISDELRSLMIDKIKDDFSRDVNEKSLTLPRNYAWPDHKLYITVVRDEEDILDTDDNRK